MRQQRPWFVVLASRRVGRRVVPFLLALAAIAILVLWWAHAEN
jgi:hypothetical protein